MSGQEAGGIGMGLFAVLLGAGGVFAALQRRRHRSEIAATYGSAGGVAYTAVQVGCSGVLILGGLGLVVLAVIAR